MTIKLKATTKKYILAGASALVSALGDLSQQLTNPNPVNWTRVLIAGVAMGVLVRVFGAVLGAVATHEAEDAAKTDTQTDPNAPKS